MSYEAELIEIKKPEPTPIDECVLFKWTNGRWAYSNRGSYEFLQGCINHADEARIFRCREQPEGERGEEEFVRRITQEFFGSSKSCGIERTEAEKGFHETYQAGFRAGRSQPIDGFHRDGCECETCLQRHIGYESGFAAGQNSCRLPTTAQAVVDEVMQMKESTPPSDRKEPMTAEQPPPASDEAEAKRISQFVSASNYKPHTYYSALEGIKKGRELGRAEVLNEERVEKAIAKVIVDWHTPISITSKPAFLRDFVED